MTRTTNATTSVCYRQAGVPAVWCGDKNAPFNNEPHSLICFGNAVHNRSLCEEARRTASPGCQSTDLENDQF